MSMLASALLTQDAGQAVGWVLLEALELSSPGPPSPRRSPAPSALGCLIWVLGSGYPRGSLSNH